MIPLLLLQLLLPPTANHMKPNQVTFGLGRGDINVLMLLCTAAPNAPSYMLCYTATIRAVRVIRVSAQATMSQAALARHVIHSMVFGCCELVRVHTEGLSTLTFLFLGRKS